MPLVVDAPAKLNLFLHITGKRADGYHLLETLAAFTEFGDRITVSSYDVLSLSITGEFASALVDEPDNLVLKAARLLQRETGCTQGAHMVLEKNIPVGSGMGGGSADAAAALTGLAQLWGLSLSRDQLPRIALQLGSDVPMCLSSQAAFVRGVGEEVTPVSLNAQAFMVLAHPRAPLLTADVYRRFAGSFTAPMPAIHSIDSLGMLLDIITPQHNALEAPAIAAMPVIADIIAALKATPHCRLARMSGSGAGCFGFYADEASAQVAAKHIQQSHPEWWCVATKVK